VPSTADLLSLRYCRLHQVNTDFGSASHMPPTDLCFHTSPKSPRVSHPWLLVFHLGSSASVLPCLRIFPSDFSLQISCQNLAFLGCAPLCSYRDSKGHQCETSCPLGVSCPFVNPHSNDSSCPCGLGAPKQACAPINRHVSWTDMPHPWVCPLPCALLVSIIVTPCGCVDGVIQPLWCAHVVEGRWVHSLGMLPSCPTLAQTQPKSSVNHSKASKVCVPPWCHMSPSCTQGAPAHTHMSSFTQPITCPFMFSFPTHPQVCPKSDLEIVTRIINIHKSLR
jgi:hypothetical protein